MKETRKTLMFCIAAVVLAALAFLTAPKPVTPDAFLDQGEAFFPDFTDPNEATTLEVVDFDEETGSAVPFKVTFKNGRWTIPSHYDHPADGKDRLAKTAAGVIGIKKDDFRSDNSSDHEACGVIDPLDETATSLTGRGQRITIKNGNDVVLADLILGKEVEGSDGMRFVRLPDHKRVYAAKVDLDISTKFSDWIEADLLKVNKDRIEDVTIRDYSIDERSGRLNERDVLQLTKNGDTWKANKMTAEQEVDRYKMNQLLTALDELKIEGVRPKPEGLTASLTRSSDSLKINTTDLLSLQNAGYYFTRDGQLVSNEGEMQARTADGVTYTLRFGEIVYGKGLAVSAGTPSDDPDAEAEGAGENRYLFITTTFDASRFPEPEQPASMDFQGKVDSLLTDDERHNKDLWLAHRKWDEKQKSRKHVSDELNARFARWYYVISAESFDKLKLTRGDILKEKKKT